MFNLPQKIDIPIGAELCYNILSVGQIKSVKDDKRCKILSSGGKSQSSSNSFACNESIQIVLPLDKQVQQFWELEQIVPMKPLKSNEEENCGRHFSDTTYDTKDGGYVVRLPFKDDPHLWTKTLEKSTIASGALVGLSN